MYMDQSKGMEIVHKPARYVLVLVPKLTTQDVHHPRRQTSGIRK
jgi:hypothetical protein